MRKKKKQTKTPKNKTVENQQFTAKLNEKIEAIIVKYMWEPVITQIER